MEDARSGPRDPEVFRMIRQDMEDLAKVYDERLLEVLGEETFKLYATYRDAVRAARGEGRGRRGRSGGGRRGGDRECLCPSLSIGRVVSHVADVPQHLPGLAVIVRAFPVPL